jgi:hypothetical protein
MALYTFILEFNGGTYISQVRSSSLKSAVKKWGRQFTNDSTTGLSAFQKKVLVDKLVIDSPTPIEVISKVWCLTASVRGKPALVNLVQTHER